MNRTAMADSTVPKPPPSHGFTGPGSGMDIARPDLARKKLRRRIILGSVGLVLIAGITVFLMRLEPAAPRMSSEPWMDSVVRGEMRREVRGNGVFVPELIRLVQAESPGTVVRIAVQAGAAVEADTVILELANPELQQSAFDSEWAARAAEAQLDKLRVSVESDRLQQESTLASLRSDARQARLEARANEVLARDGLVPAIEQERTKAKAQDLEARVSIEERRLAFAGESAKSQLAVQTAEVEKLRAMRDLRRQQVQNLVIRAGISGVLTQVGDREVLQGGQRVAANSTLAKVVVPTKLKAEIKIAETQARDVALGQKVAVDIYGVMAYSVSRRVQEIGIRIALGARLDDILMLVLRQGMGLTLAGLLIGLAGGLAVARLLSGLLFEIQPNDPPTFGAVTVLLALVALFACWWPARRAARVDPMVALRAE